MKKAGLLLMFAIIFTVSGCGSSSVSLDTVPINKVAIVSLSVNNYGAFGMSGQIDPGLLKNNVSKLLSGVEKHLMTKWEVVDTKLVVNNPDYLKNTSENSVRGLFTPSSMRVFSTNKSAIVKGQVSAQAVRDICSAIGVDAIVLVYSEWTTQVGKFVPTIKPLTKTCVAVYDKSGQKLKYGRKDMLGEKTIGGGFAGPAINEGTIDQWIDASLKAFKILI